MTDKRMPNSGVAVIDEGHSNLCQHIDDIVRHWKLGSADEVMEACVLAFRKAALSHFKEEISALEDVGAATDQHRRAHGELVEEIETLLKQTMSHSGRNRWFQLVDSLERMLFEHEIVEDSRYYSLFAEGQPG
jgi:hemerythrin-like metal-binding protein